MTASATQTAAAVVPVAVNVLLARRLLEIEWDDGTRSQITHAVLRRLCRCAECEQNRRRGREVAPPADVLLTELQPCGAGALQLVFSDGHGRGIYPFAYLRALDAPAPTLR